MDCSRVCTLTFRTGEIYKRAERQNHHQQPPQLTSRREVTAPRYACPHFGEISLQWIIRIYLRLHMGSIAFLITQSKLLLRNMPIQYCGCKWCQQGLPIERIHKSPFTRTNTINSCYCRGSSEARMFMRPRNYFTKRKGL